MIVYTYRYKNFQSGYFLYESFYIVYEFKNYCIMSYYKTFVPPKEAMEKYKTSDINFNFKNLAQIQTILHCMKTQKEDMTTNIYNAYAELQRDLKMIDNSIRDEVYRVVTAQYKKEGKVWFCGWEYSHENYIDKDEKFNYALNELLVLKTIVPEYDYFDDYEKFQKKRHEIQQIIDDFADDLWTCWSHEIIDDLAPYAEPDGLDELQEETNKTNEGTE